MSTPTSWAKALRAETAGAEPTQKPKPDERNDAAAGLVDGNKPSAPMRQAFKDLQRGVKDTDRGPEADKAYKKLKR